MKALVYDGPGKRSWTRCPTRPSRIPRTRSSGSTPSPSAAPTCTSSRATYPRSSPVACSATRPSARSSRSEPTSATSGRATACWSPASAACGRCRYCREGRYGQCTRWRRLDPRPPHRRHPGRARPGPVRRPLALRAAGRGRATRRRCMLADILPTSYEVGVLAGRCPPGDTVADRRRRPDRPGRRSLTARLFSPSADHRHRPGRVPPRARQGLGADVTSLDAGRRRASGRVA